jgi:hypothetical protein
VTEIQQLEFHACAISRAQDHCGKINNYMPRHVIEHGKPEAPAKIGELPVSLSGPIEQSDNMTKILSIVEE